MTQGDLSSQWLENIGQNAAIIRSQIAASSAGANVVRMPGVGSAAAIAPQRKAQAIVDYWPDELPPGLVGEVAQWIIDTAKKPQPRLAVAAALTLVGTAAGRHIMGPTGTGTALYVLALAETGTGKDHPMKQVDRIMSATPLKEFIGPSEFMSLTAAVETLKNSCLQLCLMDEFGAFMKRVYARQASAHERGVSKILRSVWSANFTATTLPAWKGIQSERLPAVNLSLYGSSTDREFYSALAGDTLSDGTLNRFIIAHEKKRPSYREPLADDKVVPQSIIDGIKQVFFRTRGDGPQIGLRGAPDFDPVESGAFTKLEFAPGVKGFWEQAVVRQERFAEKHPDKADMAVRTAENAIRMATIIAAGCHSDLIDVEHIEFGMRYAMSSEQAMIEGTGDHMAENETEDNGNRIIRQIKKHGGSIARSDLLRGIRGLKSRELSELTQTLAEAGRITVTTEVSGRGGPPRVTYSLPE